MNNIPTVIEEVLMIIYTVQRANLTEITIYVYYRCDTQQICCVYYRCLHIEIVPYITNMVHCEKAIVYDLVVIRFVRDEDVIGYMLIKSEDKMIYSCMWGKRGYEVLCNKYYINGERTSNRNTYERIVDAVSTSIYKYNKTLADFICSSEYKMSLPNEFNLRFYTDYIVSEVVDRGHVEVWNEYISQEEYYRDFLLCVRYNHDTYLIYNQYEVVGCVKMWLDMISCIAVDTYDNIQDYTDVTMYHRFVSMEKVVELDIQLTLIPRSILLP